MNAANQITLARILMVPVFLIFMLEVNTNWAPYVCTVIFIIAAITDSLDGYVARKYNMITNFGKFIDPLADKLLVTAALVGLVQIGSLSTWVAVIIISREFIITSFRIVAISEGKVIAASIWGKIKTVIQIVAIVALLVNMTFTVNIILLNTLVIASVIITIISGADYICKNWKLLNFN